MSQSAELNQLTFRALDVDLLQGFERGAVRSGQPELDPQWFHLGRQMQHRGLVTTQDSRDRIGDGLSRDSGKPLPWPCPLRIT